MCDLTRIKRIWSYTTSEILPSKMGIINLSFCYPKNLFFIFELFKFDESRYCTERIFYRKKRSCSVDWRCPNFSVRLCLRTRGKLMLANFRLKIGPFWDSDFLKSRTLIIMMTMIVIVIHVTLYPQVINGINKW